MVGTGGAVRPITLCLSAQGPRCTDPTIATAFDGLKIPVSRRAKFIDRSLLRSSFPGPRNEGFNRCLSPPGFPECPTVRGLRGALAPSTEMSRMTIYLVSLLGYCTGASSGSRVRITAAGRQELAGRR